MLSFVKGRALTLPLWLTNQLHKSLRCSFPSAVFAGINLWSKLGLSNGNPCRCRGTQGPPRGPCPRKETRGRITSHCLPPNLPYPPTPAFLPTPLIDRGLKTNPGRKAGLPAGAAGQAGRGAGLLADTSPGTCAALEAGQGALGTEISYSKQNIVLYETIKKVPEGGPKYILYFTLNPCFDLTL